MEKLFYIKLQVRSIERNIYYMNIKIDLDFDQNVYGSHSNVFEIFPNIYNDQRGSFTEVLKHDVIHCEQILPIYQSIDWIKQINRSTSVPNVCRGLHAQKYFHCQSKLVECVQGIVYDIIVDARPQSKTFGKLKIYKLDSTLGNKLFVPRGFLHGFISGNVDSVKENIFQYFCGEIFDKSVEVNVNLVTALEYNKLIITENNKKYLQFSTQNCGTNELIKFEYDSLIFSDKDLNGINITDWLNYVNTNDRRWYV